MTIYTSTVAYYDDAGIGVTVYVTTQRRGPRQCVWNTGTRSDLLKAAEDVIVSHGGDPAHRCHVQEAQAVLDFLQSSPTLCKVST